MDYKSLFNLICKLNKLKIKIESGSNLIQVVLGFSQMNIFIITIFGYII